MSVILRFMTMAFVIAATASAQAATARIEYQGHWWTYDDKKGKVEVVEYAGKQALRVRGSTCAVIQENSRMRDGTISLDVATGDYNGFTFRAASLQDAETVYFRPGKNAGREIQYIARGLGDWGSWAWLRKNHPGVYEKPANIGKSTWIHVDAVIDGKRLEVRIDGSTEPVMVIPDMRHPVREGGVGFYGWNGHFANLTFTPAAVDKPADQKAP